MRRLSVLLLPLLAGCVANEARQAGRDEIALARDLSGRQAGEAQTCLPVPIGPGSLQAVNNRTLVYRQGRTIWVNRLAADCPGLRPLSTIIIGVQSGGYCRGDHIRARQPNDIIAGPVCSLGDFTPYRAASR